LTTLVPCTKKEYAKHLKVWHMNSSGFSSFGEIAAKIKLMEV